jgi:mannose-1-phosphate guanylyltransferase/phosphomannomutase
VHCEDLQVAPAPAVRFGARLGGSRAGLYVRTGRNDSQSIEIGVFNDHGGDIDEAARRRVERTYFREEFRRAFGQQMGLLRYPPRVLEQYMSAMADCVDVDVVRARRFKVVIDAGAGTCSMLLPQYIADLNLDAMVVNDALDEGRVAPSAEQRQADDDRLAQVVRNSGAALGARLDSVGERLSLVGRDGQPVPHDQALLLFVDLLARAGSGGKLALPVSTSRRAEELAAAGGCEVVWTKLAASSLMAAARQPGVVFAGSDGGEYVFPDLHPAYDALLALGKLLEMLAQEGVDLSAALGRLPPTQVLRRRIATPWDAKGTVMRQVVDSAKGLRTDATDGVKVFHDGGWVLVLPDTVEPATHIWAEADDHDQARRLADQYERLVRGSSGED